MLKLNYKEYIPIGILSIILMIPIFISSKLEMQLIYDLYLVIVVSSICIIDMRYKLIPNKLLLIWAIIGIILLFITRYISIIDSLIGGLLGGGIFLLLAIITKQMGGGDIKYMALLGMLLGVRKILIISCLSFVVALPVCIFLLISKRCSIKDSIAFGPMISVATYILLITKEIFYA
ncbi:prepilin peptidase (plasmid) [Vallitalea pronyensis]|uniref:Prepilin peptidase n=1 Tax=Vallitalea pronyensis TaxID=1348613 RepID=A0A8J8MQJ6_9FIRM|nr:A24 family peptidase [Vallitalea pronyensis]QUI25951.1 prepilin peptidase [Vallitalea pronyensis]